MLSFRIIPTLLLSDGGLVKGSKFKAHKYVGDPINAVKIFNEKEVDELIFLDITASRSEREPNFDLIADIAGEAFMPLGYGGGVKTLKHIERLFSLGIEKAVINSSAFINPSLVSEAAGISGSQSIVISIDVRRSLFGAYEVYVNSGLTRTKTDPITYAKTMEDLGAGELILCSIDREGTGKGFDIELLDDVAKAVDIPVVGLGGAGSAGDLVNLRRKTSVSAAAAGDLFIFHGKHKAVLITYPDYKMLEELFSEE